MGRLSEEAKIAKAYRQHSGKAKQVMQYVTCAPDHEELFMPSERDELYPLRTGNTLSILNIKIMTIMLPYFVFRGPQEQQCQQCQSLIQFWQLMLLILVLNGKEMYSKQK